MDGSRVKEEVFETPDLGLAEDELKSTERYDVVNKVPDAEVVSSFVPPQAAFEVFMGRTYTGAREDMSDAVGASASRTSDGAVYSGEGYRREGGTTSLEILGGTAAAGDSGGEGPSAEISRPALRRWRTGESPVQRLVRLREETALLAEDLQEMAEARRREETGTDAEGGGKGGEGSGSAAEAERYALWSAMARETEALQRELAQLSEDPQYKLIVSPAPRTAAGESALQARLSEGVIKALERLREVGEGDGPESKVAEALSSTTGNAADSSVTFELFLKEASAARRRLHSPATGETDLPGVEARIAALEKALGGGGGGGSVDGVAGTNAGVSLAEAVASLEKRVVLLEPGRLDSLRQKAQLAKAELDGLAKARALASSSGAAGSARQKKVEEAFNTLQTWQGLAAGLPSLVDRLRALETLHLASASFAQRLEQMEGAQEELMSVLKTTGEALEATRTSAAENVAIVEENVRALDTRLAAVGMPS